MTAPADAFAAALGRRRGRRRPPTHLTKGQRSLAVQMFWTARYQWRTVEELCSDTSLRSARPNLGRAEYPETLRELVDLELIDERIDPDEPRYRINDFGVEALDIDMGRGPTRGKPGPAFWGA